MTNDPKELDVDNEIEQEENENLEVKSSSNVDEGTTYSGDDITVLEGLDPVRKRPGMYIGSTGPRGLHHLVYEVVDNSVDEALAGYATQIDITIHPDNSMTVVDDGRGIPVNPMPEQDNKSAAEVVLTVLHAGGKFGGEDSGYKVSGGLHGVGISVVNALSDRLSLKIFRDGNVWEQEYAEGGNPQGPLLPTGDSDKTGTSITFHPDPLIFEEIEFDYDTLRTRFRETAFLTKGLKINLTDERGAGAHDEFMAENGLIDFIAHLNQNKEPVQAKVISFEAEEKDTQVDVAMQWTTSYTASVFAYANNINTHEGGTHLTGFKAALTRVINSYAREKGLLKEKEENLSSNDIFEGLSGVISLKMPEPQFEGQTKTKLGNSYVRGIVEGLVNKKLGEFFEENPAEAKIIVQRAVSASQARQAALKARDLTRKKGEMSAGTLPGKLADCSSDDPTLTELWLAEGDSAGGSAKTGRDREIQAILPLRGKIINSEKALLHKVLASTEIQSMVTAIGAGIGDTFDITKARYHNIVIACDADVDGAHIRALILTFFFRQMPELIDAGYVYIAQPPLYKVSQGKKEKYLQTEKDLEEFLLKQNLHKVSIKGLSGAEETWDDKKFHLFSAKLRELDGWLKTLYSHYSRSLTEFVQATDLMKHKITTKDELVKWLEELKDNHAEIDEVNILSQTDEEVSISYFNAETSYMKKVVIPLKFFTETAYQGLQKVTLELEQNYQTGPFEVVMNKKDFTAANHVELRQTIIEAMREGMELQRYKGLGEMNPEQLWETTMDPEKRMLQQVQVDDAARADEIFTMLMGDEVEPRRAFIEKHAKEANIDL